jgi:hypothetical protein
MGLLFLLVSLTWAGCNDPGIEFYCRGTRIKILDKAWTDATGTDGMGSQVFELVGGFIPPETTKYEFEFWQEGYSSSANENVATEFYFEDERKGSGGNKEKKFWWWYPDTLYKDFRYMIKQKTTDHFYYVTMSITVKYPPPKNPNVLNPIPKEYLRACHQKGCANTAHSCEYNCQPSPTRSPFATPTISPLASPTISPVASPTI